jgi:AraC-like DNA-binding protein
MAGREVCSDDYAVRRSGYPSLALEIVEEGEGILRLGRKTTSLRPGMIFTYGPGIAHSIRAVPGSRLVKCFVDFTGAEGEGLLAHVGLAPGRIALARDSYSMLRLMELMLSRGDSATAQSHALCADYLRALLRLAGEHRTVESASGKSSDCHMRALALIERDHQRIRSVAELARRLGVTPEHLARSFKAMGDEAPLRRLVALRMNHAAHLLVSRGSQVKRVAADLGYANPFHFSAVFKRHFGFPPKSLRKRDRGMSV